MGLRIDVTTVVHLLLQDDLWIGRFPRSLIMDSFEWTNSEDFVINAHDMAVASTTGVRFKTRGLNGWISCPLPAIVAVHYEPVELEDSLAASMPALLAEEIDPPLR